MVQGIPEIKVGITNATQLGNPGTDRIWGICIESTKGPSFTPTLVYTPNQLYQQFKVRLDGFWGVGGQGLEVTRVTAGTPAKAEQTLVDNSATPVSAITITAKQEGSYAIYISGGANSGGGSNLIIEESGYQTEFYTGVQSIADLVNRINSDSQIVDAELVAEGSGTLGTLTRQQLGAAIGATDGSDGTVKNGSTTGELADADAPAAHRQGLALMEYLDIRGVFTMKSLETVQAEYAVHADYMSAADVNRCRYAVIGAPTGTVKADMLENAAGYDNEHILYVGQGLVDKNGVEYAPCEATIAVAGKRSALHYGTPAWGGEGKKRLGVNDDQFFVDVLPIVDDSTLTTTADLRDYNEGGVITFQKNVDGIRIRELITTVQSDNLEEEDEEAVVSIKDRARIIIAEAAFEFSGKPITPSYKSDLEEYIKSQLDEMKNVDQTLIDVSDEGLSAYTVSATIVPRANQRLGKVSIEASIVPVHAARAIDISIVVL